MAVAMAYQSPERASGEADQEKRKLLERRKQAAATRQRLVSYPAGITGDYWTLWKPGVDPATLQAEYDSQVRRRRTIAVLLGLLATLAIAVGVVFLVGAAFAAGFWWGVLSILGSLVVGGGGTIIVWDQVGTTATDEGDRFIAWIRQSHGTDCFAAGSQLNNSEDATKGAAARRIVLAVKSIYSSYSLKTGWLQQDTAIRAHEDAWNSLSRTASVSPAGREHHLGEVAASLEAVADEVKALDAELQSREKSEELRQLKAEYLKVKDHAVALQEDVQARRKFLTENPE